MHKAILSWAKLKAEVSLIPCQANDKSKVQVCDPKRMSPSPLKGSPQQVEHREPVFERPSPSLRNWPVHKKDCALTDRETSYHHLCFERPWGDGFVAVLAGGGHGDREAPWQMTLSPKVIVNLKTMFFVVFICLVLSHGEV